MIKITYNDKEFKQMMDKMKSSLPLYKRNLLDKVIKLRSELQETQFSGKRGNVGLNTQSGKAKYSWRIKDIGSDVKFNIDLYSNVKYIEYQENNFRKLRLRTWWENRASKLLAETVQKTLKGTV